jgi:multiple sugar transport system substrate-binding protein
LVVNVDAFRKVGLAPPAVNWDLDAFENAGREYVKRANADGKGPRKFFLGCIFSFPRTEHLFRGMGLTYFNETYTLPIYHQPKTIAAWKRLRKWMAEYHLFPALSDRQSVNVEFGYGGSLLQLLASGRYAMGEGGRWSMIQMRKFKEPVNWDMVLYPHGGWPNALVGSRSAVLYKGGKNKNHAIAFLGFLRSDEYNMTIVKGSDGLPPNPKFMDTPEFLTPTGYSNEWPLHRANRLLANQYACSSEISPFVLLANIRREESRGD